MRPSLFHLLAPLQLLAQGSRAANTTEAPLCLMYLTGQRDFVPSMETVSRVTHVALAFMASSTFNNNSEAEWPIFRSIEDTRKVFKPDTKVIVAIGGWGDTAGFEEAARNASTQAKFAKNVARMINATGADGVDIDWEYPGGNGDDYKIVPNSSKVWEIKAFPLLVSAIRAAIGPNKIITAAVPGLERDMMAFTPETVPVLMQSIDYFNVMTYDLMNRRDNITKHHTGLNDSLASIDAYMARGAPATKLNLGFAFYAKYMQTEHDACVDDPIGCPTLQLEDPVTGADLGRAGAFAYSDTISDEVSVSFERALANGTYDAVGGGYYYWDSEQDKWWTFDTPMAIMRKFPEIVVAKGLAGVFAWGLGEDAPKYEHLTTVTQALDAMAVSDKGLSRDELVD